MADAAPRRLLLQADATPAKALWELRALLDDGPSAPGCNRRRRPGTCRCRATGRRVIRHALGHRPEQHDLRKSATRVGGVPPQRSHHPTRITRLHWGRTVRAAFIRMNRVTSSPTTCGSRRPWRSGVPRQSAAARWPPRSAAGSRQAPWCSPTTMASAHHAGVGGPADVYVEPPRKRTSPNFGVLHEHACVSRGGRARTCSFATVGFAEWSSAWRRRRLPAWTPEEDRVRAGAGAAQAGGARSRRASLADWNSRRHPRSVGGAAAHECGRPRRLDV